MNVLFLTDEFYPQFGANSLIVKTVALEMTKRGIQVFVMPAGYDRSLSEKEEYKGIQIIRGMPADNMENVVSSFRKSKYISSANVVIRHYAIKLSRHESLWHKDRVLAREYLRNYIIENSIDAVISINCSIELSFPIYWLKKQKKVKCKWFFYMLDPFESHMYYRGHYSIEELRKWQHRIMSTCDGVFATRIICDEVKVWEKESINEKLSQLEFPKIEEPSCTPCSDDIILPDDTINVVCTGSRNEAVRNSDFALRVCKSIPNKNVLFHFVGIGWTDIDARREENCIYYTPRSWQAIRNLQCNAEYLLNIGNIVSNQLPSKVLEYISTGVPIINFYKIDKCPTLKLLKEYDALNIYEKDSESAKERLRDFLSGEHERALFETVRRQYEQYTPEYVSGVMIREINRHLIS